MQGPGASSRAVTGTGVLPLPYRYDVEVVGLVVSPVHRYDGRPGAVVPRRRPTGCSAPRCGPGTASSATATPGRAAHRDAALTVLAVESLEALAAELGVPPFDPLLARRTVVLRGAEVEALRGTEFALDCGEGVGAAARRPAGQPVRLDGRRPGARRAPGHAGPRRASAARRCPTACSAWARPS